MEHDKADHLYRALKVVDSGARKKQVQGGLRELAAWAAIHHALLLCRGWGLVWALMSPQWLHSLQLPVTQAGHRHRWQLAG